MLSLNKMVFNESNWNDFVVIGGRECYMMVIQLNSDGEVDYTIFDGWGDELDGGVYEEENVSYKDLFKFAGWDKFDGDSRKWVGDDARNYVNSMM